MKRYFLFSIIILLASYASAYDDEVTRTAEQLATSNGWNTGGFYGSFQLSDIVSITANQPDTGSVNGYYSPDTPHDWRLYQARNNGEFTISVPAGYSIRSVQFTYTATRTGVLSTTPGTNIATSQRIASGQTFSVQAPSITLYAGNTGTGLKGQVRISSFTVVYTDSTSIAERFTQVKQSKNNDQETIWHGDYADWNVLYARRNATDTLNGGVQGSWCKGGGYFQSINATGGVKHLRFEWRQFVKDSVELTLAMEVGSDWKDTARIQSIVDQAESKNYLFDKQIACKENAQLSFRNISSSTSSANRFLLGNLYITPYLYIDADSRSFIFTPQMGSFDLSTILYDNTDGEGQIVYSILSDQTGKASIQGSIVDFSRVTSNGTIWVRASWNDGKVFTDSVSLYITLNQNDESVTETLSSCSYSKLSNTTYVVGDQGVYGWNLTHFARQESDTIMGIQGTRIGYNGGIRMNGVQEGGIKALSFYWRATSALKPVHFIVSVDGNEYNVKQKANAANTELTHYQKLFNIEHNSAVSVTMGAKEDPEQSEIVVGPIEITPYLLFRKRQDTIDIEQTTTYRLDSALINNTSAQVVYSIFSDPTGNASLSGALLDLSTVTQPAKIVVQAAWEQVTTTMTIYVKIGTTALPTLTTDQQPTQKLLRNGQLLILRDGKYYSPLGILL